MIVELSHKAIAELGFAVAFVRQDSPRAAGRIQAAIERALESLSDMPQRGRHGRIFGTRELLVRGAPYVIVYNVTASAVVVLSIRHTRRGVSA